MNKDPKGWEEPTYKDRIASALGISVPAEYPYEVTVSFIVAQDYPKNDGTSTVWRIDNLLKAVAQEAKREGVRATLNNYNDMIKAWTEYRGDKTYGEFAIWWILGEETNE